MTYPKQILIIRHAEKTNDADDIHLSPRGYQRARLLPTLFAPAGRLARPGFLFAAARSKHSNRSVETLEPLAQTLGLPIDHGYDDDEYRDLARRLKARKYADAVALVCWHHSSIPALAKALGVKAAALPWKTWPDDCFDRVWILSFGLSGSVGVESVAMGLDL